MADEWTDWIEHDGGRPNIPKQWVAIQTRFGGQGIEPPDAVAGDAVLDLPNFYWRWQTVKTGWFRKERRRVCDDPAYAPIIRYRFRKPRAVPAGLTILQQLVADPPPLVETDDPAPVAAR